MPREKRKKYVSTTGWFRKFKNTVPLIKMSSIISYRVLNVKGKVIEFNYPWGQYVFL